MSDTPNYCKECREIFEDYELEYYSYPTHCPDCKDPLVNFDSENIDILERIDNPIYKDEWETAASDEITRLRADNAKLREALEIIRDEARTGVAPEAFGMTPRQWDQHKLNYCARHADKALEETK